MSKKTRLRFVATTPYLIEAMPLPAVPHTNHYCAMKKTRKGGGVVWTLVAAGNSDINCFSHLHNNEHPTFKEAQLQVHQAWKEWNQPT